ncbi:MAG: Arc family DNA-binding protein [Rhodocyclaceae bacterium]|nr:Arc family DNA-binding protein [Rhodocyclaceae bacterium]
MPNLSIKDVPEALAEKIRQRAVNNHRSLQGELMALLEGAGNESPHAPSMLMTAEPIANYAVSPSVSNSATNRERAFPMDDLWGRFDAMAAENRLPRPVPETREARVRRLREIASQVNPAFRAADRLTREQANDRAFLRNIGL